MAQFDIDDYVSVEVGNNSIVFLSDSLDFQIETVTIPLDKWQQVKEFIDNELKSKATKQP